MPLLLFAQCFSNSFHPKKEREVQFKGEKKGKKYDRERKISIKKDFIFDQLRYQNYILRTECKEIVHSRLNRESKLFEKH